MVITGAADREPGRIMQMIYFDAFLPASGQGIWDLASPAIVAAQKAASTELGGHAIPRPPASRLTEEERRRFWPLYRPQPTRTHSDRWTTTRSDPTWPPRHYIWCEKNVGSAFEGFYKSLDGKNGWTRDTIAAFHEAPYSEPALSADAIARAVSHSNPRGSEP